MFEVFRLENAPKSPNKKKEFKLADIVKKERVRVTKVTEKNARRTRVLYDQWNPHHQYDIEVHYNDEQWRRLSDAGRRCRSL